MSDDRCCAPRCHMESTMILVRDGKKFPLCDKHTEMVMSEDDKVAARTCKRFKIPPIPKSNAVYQSMPVPAPAHSSAPEPEPEETEAEDTPTGSSVDDILSRLAAGEFDLDEEE